MRPINNFSRLFLLVAVFGTAGSVRADDSAPPAGPYTLQYKFAAGDVKHYSMSIDINSTMNVNAQTKPMNIHMDMTEGQTVQSVRPQDGVAVAQVVIATSSALMNGQPLPPDAIAKMSPPPMTMVVSPLGQVISTTMSAGQSPMPGMSNPNAFGALAFLPSKPVNVGDTWTDSIPIAGIDVTLNCTMTLKSVQTINGETICQIETSFMSTPTALAAGQTAPRMATSLTGDTISNFDIGAGAITSIKGGMSTDIIPASAPAAGTPGMHIHMDMKTQMTLLPT